MVFNSNDELPARIKKQFPSNRVQTIFRKSFNSVFKESKNESSAFAIATSAAQRAMKKEKLSSALLDLHLVRLNAIQTNKKNFVKIVFEQDIVLNEELSMGSDMTIEGIALQEGTVKGVYYSASFLNKVAKTFIGVPLRFDHDKGVRDIAGKITHAFFDPIRKAIRFTAIVFHDLAKRVLKEGLVSSVSVGILVDVVRGKKGVEARDGVGKEISLVDIPACKTCKIEKVDGE